MALRVRCPHCEAVLVAADDQAGRAAHCSECGRGFTMPIPSASTQAPPVRTEVSKPCVRCGGALAPGASLCRKCLTVVATGQRLPFTKRLGYVSARTWVIAASALAILTVAGWAGTEYALTLWKAAPGRDRVPSPANEAEPTVAANPAEGRARQAASALLTAGNAAERRSALDELARIGPSSIAPLLTTMKERLPGANSEGARRGYLAAIDFLADQAARDAIQLISELQKVPALRAACVRTRALFGDATVSDELRQEWIAVTRRKLLFERVAALQNREGDAATAAALQRARHEADRLAEGLRKLSEPDDSDTFEKLLAALFPSWGWLGQERDERFAVELWEAAKPPRGADQDFRHRVRAARRVLDRTAQRAGVDIKAAAGIVLAQSGPQYQSLKREIVDQIAKALPDAKPLEQQRGVWALARLAGTAFGAVTAEQTPSDVDAAALSAAIEWAARQSGAPASARRAASGGELPAVPTFTRRVVTPERQLEARLLADLSRDWQVAGPALDRWMRGNLGFTPRIAERLNASRPADSPVAAATAIYLAAALGPESVRGPLELWRSASDQPAWVRGAAVIALHAVDARAGRKVDNWLASLTPEMIADLETPGALNLWGRLIRVGGKPLLEKLQKDRTTLNESTRDRLLRASI